MLAVPHVSSLFHEKEANWYQLAPYKHSCEKCHAASFHSVITHDACSPNLTRLRWTSIPKSRSLRSRYACPFLASQCRNTDKSASGSARSSPTHDESEEA